MDGSIQGLSERMFVQMKPATDTVVNGLTHLIEKFNQASDQANKGGGISQYVLNTVNDLKIRKSASVRRSISSGTRSRPRFLASTSCRISLPDAQPLVSIGRLSSPPTWKHRFFRPSSVYCSYPFHHPFSVDCCAFCLTADLVLIQNVSPNVNNKVIQKGSR